MAPVSVDERLLQLGGRDLARPVRVHGAEPLGHVGVHLALRGSAVARGGAGTAQVAARGGLLGAVALGLAGVALARRGRGGAARVAASL